MSNHLGTHGMSTSKVYHVWYAIKRRCNDPRVKSYADYGARGISYDPKWESFKGFWEDMQEGYAEGLTIDRKEVNKDYCKNNCRWSTRDVQAHGTRKRKDAKSSKYKGVALQPNGLWTAQIQKNGRVLRSSKYETEREAALQYDELAVTLWGDTATTNKSLGLLNE